MRKYSELLTIPAALLLLVLYNLVATEFGLHVFTWEQFGKVFAAFLIFLVAVGFVRIAHMSLFPILYKYLDPSFKENEKWKLLTEKEKFKYSFYLFVAFLILFGQIVNGL
ncbi:MAG TPA: hypothetical protein VFG54_12085 [Prolixibacteraceae bacterium]|nr:hypothetical protein [Prolixibacteraceae bacterium]